MIGLASGLRRRFACVVFVLAAACSARAAELSVVPVRASGAHTIVGNEIILPSGGQDIEVHVFLSGFAPQEVATYQAEIDCAPIDGTGDIQAISTNCLYVGFEFGVDYCLGVNEAHPRYVLAAANGTLPACSNVTVCPSGDPGAFACGAVALSGGSGPDDGEPYYGVQFAFHIGADARGSYVLGLDPDGNSTLVRDTMAREIPITSVIPAVVTIPTGSCCGDGGFLGCRDDVTQGECAGTWTAGESCAGVEGTNPGRDASCPCCDPFDPQRAECDDQNACTVDACDPVTCCMNIDTTPAGMCCRPEDASLTVIDDGNDCTVDVCHPDGSVTHEFVAEGTGCNDGYACTAGDACDGAGVCVGANVNELVCEDLSDCPAGAQACADGHCACSTDTEFRLDVVPDMACFAAGEAFEVNVVMGPSGSCATGAQFLVQYDPACVSYEGLSAGEAMPLLVYEEPMASSGMVFGAVGVMPGPNCIQGPAVLATLTFEKSGACGDCQFSFDNINPRNTILSDDAGNAVPLALVDSREVRLAGGVWLDTPEGITTVHAECDAPVATVTWPAVTASGECDSEPVVSCEVMSSTGLDLSHLALQGGLFPRGLHNFACTATTSCGQSVTREWQVEVLDLQSLHVELQLSPIMVGDPLTRCICFEFFQDCVQAPTVWCEEITFGFPYDFRGHATKDLKIPKGQYACITARDPLHTLRSVSEIDCFDNRLYATFAGDPVFGGNWLIGGNLDAFKEGGNPDVIDILDFGMLIGQLWESIDEDSSCDRQGPHGDVNGDGMVDTADFTFISMNHLEASKNACCDDATAAMPAPVTSITVKELRRRGLPELVSADLNGDGLLDAADVAAYLAGARPEVPRGGALRRGGGSVGGR